MRVAATVSAAVPTPIWRRAPWDQPRRRPRHARCRVGPHWSGRPDDRRPPALYPARFQADVHHRRGHERAAAPHRPSDRWPSRHQRHHGLQGGLPRRGDPGPPGVPRPASGDQTQRSAPAWRRSATTCSPASPRPNARAGWARSKASRSASPAPTTSSPSSTGVLATPSPSTLACQALLGTAERRSAALSGRYLERCRMAQPQPGDPGSTTTGEAHVRQRIDSYADQLQAAGAIRSAAVERAFRIVERHRLLETFHTGPPDFTLVHSAPEHPTQEHLEVISADDALGTRFIDGMPASSTSQPSLVAEMLELLDLLPGMRVLEIGAGTGYNAALMAELVGDQPLVVTIDVLDDVVAQTRRLLARAGYPDIAVLVGDGVEGAPERAPFDRIVATVGCSDLSPRWAEQVDLHFYLSLRDRRACWAPERVGLSDGPNGWAVASPDGIRWWKAADLAAELDRVHADWLACGRPALGDYQVAFIPIDAGAMPPPGGWALDRRFFRELVWLGKPSG